MRKIFVVPIFAFAACAGRTLTHHDAVVAPSSPKPVVAFALPEPPKGITTTMASDPSVADLAQARLVPTTCDAIEKDDADAEIAAMRKAVDASFKSWVEQQQSCSDDSFGSGGLGLGNIGTIGHGAGTGSARSAREFSTTNNQVASVDEADIVKTDGRWVYLASNGALRIIEAMNPTVLSVTHIAGVARELFVEGDRAVVYSSSGDGYARCKYGYDCTFGGDGTTTKISIYDVSDRSSPKLAREIDLSGSLMAARRVGNAVHTVVADNDAPVPRWHAWPTNLSFCGGTQAVVASKLTMLKAENERLIHAAASRIPTITDGGKTTRMCSGLARTALRDGDAFTSIVSFDLTNDRAPVTTATMQSRPGAVFASEAGLYVSVVHRKSNAKTRWYSYYDDAIDEVSEIHKFRIGAAPSDTKYVGSGTIPGHVLGQLAMDEWFGYLRVATTKGRVPDPNVESAISILAETASGALTRVGAISHIAPGEDIRAVRFDNERGYVV
ncbi:MAG TPA: beta-propeller domain-containing protein, partial [Polyangiaceae bacterium]